MGNFALGMFAQRVEDQLNRIETLINQMAYRSEIMSVELDNLTVEVTEIGTVVDSAVLLLETLSTRLAAIANDPAAITALATELDTKAKTLADAIVANTPVVEEEPVVEPPVEPIEPLFNTAIDKSKPVVKKEVTKEEPRNGPNFY